MPDRLVSAPFLLRVENVYSISGRGTVVTGCIERGTVRVNDEVEIVGLKPTVKSTCTSIEIFRRFVDEGRAGDNAGILLSCAAPSRWRRANDLRSARATRRSAPEGC